MPDRDPETGKFVKQGVDGAVPSNASASSSDPGDQGDPEDQGEEDTVVSLAIRYSRMAADQTLKAYQEKYSANTYVIVEDTVQRKRGGELFDLKVYRVCLKG